MKKKVLIIVLTLCLVFQNVTFAATWNTLAVLMNGMTVKVNGQIVQSDNILYNGTTYLPLRAVSEALGAKVNYIDETKTADITINNSQINNTGLDYNAVKIGSMYILIESYVDAINSDQYVSRNILSALINNYNTETQISSDISKYEENLKKNYSMIKEDLSNFQRSSNQYSDNSIMLEDFVKISKYFNDIEAMEKNKIQLLRNIITYGFDDTVVDRYYKLEGAIFDSFNAIDDISVSNYYNINNYILFGNNYNPASNEYNFPNSYFITVPTNIEQTSSNSYSNSNTTNVSSSYSFPLYLYSNDGKVYLGKLVTNKYDTDSIWNTYGNYGSKYSSSSIWNTYSDYGSTYSNTSAFNKYATSPPKIVDNKGNFVGYLTTNEYLTNGYPIEVIRQFLIDNYQ